MAEPITTFSIHEPWGRNRTNTYVTLGCPLPKGKYFISSHLSVKNEDGKTLPHVINPVAFWPDNSMKWLIISVCLDLQANSTLKLQLSSLDQPESKQPNQSECPEISITNDQFVAQTSNYQLLVNRSVSKPFTLKYTKQYDQQVTKQITLSPYLHGSLQSSHSQSIKSEVDIDEIDFRTEYFNAEFFQTIIDIPLIDMIDGNMVTRRKITLSINHLNNTLAIETQVHNPLAATHPNGQWDLGDPNALFIDKYGVELCLAEPTKNSIKLAADDAVIELQDSAFGLHQESSAGQNWNSPNHVNCENQITPQYAGYEWVIGDAAVNRFAKRADPILTMVPDSGALSVSIYIRKFWQNFPIGLEGHGSNIDIKCFSANRENTVELQPGEKKTHRIDINLSGTNCDDAQFPVHTQLDYQWVIKCKSIHGLSDTPICSQLENIIQLGVDKTHGFRAKREAVDEYGWRNFGELYADHETAEYSGDEIFVSHYNNQYDPLLGLIKQWLKTGDEAWWKLADELAEHITDIDIYDTENDKPEYSGGLFWHTDHYVSAYTATHRTYSKHQPSDVYKDHAGGGGPGGQHCYTGGLALHYFLTGKRASRDAVLKISRWISQVYEGDGSLFSLLLQFKNRHRVDLKNVMHDTYPLDRGTANYVNALLDCYELTHQSSFFAAAQSVLMKTVSQHDDLQQRRLDDIESHWFYTVLLQSLCRTLYVKQIRKEYDSHYFDLIDALLLYARWMTDNEYNYLEKPEKLEYPNQTWSAQDLRKSQILRFASNFVDEIESAKMIEKAEHLQSNAITSIVNSDEQHYTRILALVMQNAGDILIDKTNMNDKKHVQTPKNLKRMTFPQLLVKGLQQFSFAYELQQAKKRFPSVFKKLGIE